MTRFRMLAICAVLAVPMAGCLVKDTTQTWYVNGTGEVAWVVTERDVRSDANAVADRQQEEAEYWLAVQQQRHPIAAGLQELGGSKLRTLVLRGEAPYTVQTDARFTGIDELGRRILATSGLMGTSIVTRDGATWDWKIVIRDPSSLNGVVGEPSDGISALLGDLETLQVVLTSGHFESATGFTISSDRRVATFDKKEEKTGQTPEEPVMTLRLVWK
jgi:hypothetical protein